MKIEWNISKKRGNLRPTLSYSFVVEKYEKALALPPILIESTIPEPLESWQEHCYPSELERADTPKYKGFYRLELVSHRGNMWKQSLRLPWREDNNYPEIEESFNQLRLVFENELKRANNSEPMEETSYLQISDLATQNLAPQVLAEKFLNFAKRENGFV